MNSLFSKKYKTSVVACTVQEAIISINFYSIIFWDSVEEHLLNTVKFILLVKEYILCQDLKWYLLI